MTHRQRMLAALRGEPTDRLPWAPRLDLWYAANRRAGTLPPQIRNASLEEITDLLDIGFHAVIPRFRDLRHPDDDIHRALGVYNLWTMPCRTRFTGVRCAVHRDGDRTTVEYHTPLGTVRTTVLYDEAMRAAGISITHIAEHAIKSPDDYGPVAYLFDHAEVEPQVDGYSEFDRQVGDRGIAVAFLNLAASPLHLLLRELMPMEQFYFESVDHPEELAACAETIGGYFQRLFSAAADCPAEVFLLGANYDAGVTPPPWFRRAILPWLQLFARMLHDRGKMLLTHTDGENTGLLDLYQEAGIDIADSICPAPMTRLTLKEVREAFRSTISIMGGIPSVCLLRSSMSDSAFAESMDTFFRDLGVGDHLILGISDTTPPAAEFSRLQALTERVRAFGPVDPAVGKARSSSGPSPGTTPGLEVIKAPGQDAVHRRS